MSLISRQGFGIEFHNISVMKNQERDSISLPIGLYNRMQKLAQARGLTVEQFIEERSRHILRMAGMAPPGEAVDSPG